MIRLDAVTQNYRAAAPIFFDVSLDIPTNRRVALLGVAQSGKTTLIQMLAGLMAPSSGTIHRMARLSFPAGYQRGFRMGASVRQNLAFAAQIYDADEGDLFEFVGEVTGLQDLLDAPLKDLAVQERVNLSFALTYALPFDTFLFDNTIGAGDAAFRERCQAMYDARAQEAGTIVATKNTRTAQQLCDCAVVISDFGLTFYDDIEAGVAAFNEQPGAVAQTPAPTSRIAQGGAQPARTGPVAANSVRASGNSGDSVAAEPVMSLAASGHGDDLVL